MRVDALKKQFDTVAVFCDVAQNANASVAAETIEKARIAFDRVLDQLGDARHVSARDAAGLQEKITHIKAKLLQANERLRELRGSREGLTRRAHVRPSQGQTSNPLDRPAGRAKRLEPSTYLDRASSFSTTPLARATNSVAS